MAKPHTGITALAVTGLALAFTAAAGLWIESQDQKVYEFSAMTLDSGAVYADPRQIFLQAAWVDVYNYDSDEQERYFIDLRTMDPPSRSELDLCWAFEAEKTLSTSWLGYNGISDPAAKGVITVAREVECPVWV